MRYAAEIKHTAASARLCVETRFIAFLVAMMNAAASARLCVETDKEIADRWVKEQPPPRGCVLKQQYYFEKSLIYRAAASARLCVETPLRVTSNFIKVCSRLRAAVC